MPVATTSPTDVSLREVTAATVRAVAALRVAPEQEPYVASNAVSIAEAYFHDDAWFRAVCVGEALAGFVMLRDPTLLALPPSDPEFSLWRFMIDHRFQRSGVGRMALSKVVAHVRTRRGARALHTSYVPGPRSPSDFYLSFGFRPTGRVRASGEIALVLELS